MIKISNKSGIQKLISRFPYLLVKLLFKVKYEERKSEFLERSRKHATQRKYNRVDELDVNPLSNKTEKNILRE